MMLVTFFSLYSFEGVGSPQFSFPHTDKIVHFIFYFGACILGVFFLREQFRANIPLENALLIMIVATVIFGICIEIIQHTLTENRTGDVFDVLANTLGSIFGAAVQKYLFLNKRQLK